MGISATKNGDLSERCAFNQTKIRDQISQLPWDWPSAEVLHRPEAQLQRFVSGDSVESGSFLVRKNGGAPMMDSYTWCMWYYVVVNSWMYWSYSGNGYSGFAMVFPCFSSWGLPLSILLGMIPIDFTYCSRDQIVTIYEPNSSEILDYVLGALNHQPINFFIIFRWYIPSINR